VVSAYNTSTFVGSGTAGYADGVGSLAMFNVVYLGGIAMDAAGNLIVGDQMNHRVRKVTPAGVVTTLAGSGIGSGTFSGAYADGTGTSASFFYANGVTLDSAGNVYLCDGGNQRIRMITPSGSVTTFAGSGTAGWADGVGTAARFNFPDGIAVDSSGNFYVGEETGNRVRKISPTGNVTTLAGSGTGAFADGVGTNAAFNVVPALAVDAAGNLFVADFNNRRIRKISPAGVVTTLAGSGSPSSADGLGTAASFNGPAGIALDSAGNAYVGDRDNYLVRLVRPSGMVTTLAGAGTAGKTDGIGTAATFSRPTAVTLDGVGNVYVLDNSCIRKMQLMHSSGTLPNLAAYTSLTSLKISGLNTILSGTIPDMFAGMTALTNLDLSGNALSGTLPPSAVALCSKTGVTCNVIGGTNYVTSPPPSPPSPPPPSPPPPPLSPPPFPGRGVFTCTQSDAVCSALGDFYYSTVGASWSRRAGWSSAAAGTPTSYCTFTGLICSGTGVLTYFQLDTNNLAGSIPSSFGPGLTSLTRLCVTLYFAHLALILTPRLIF
jgi:sugar lactone lactonase YvrE